MSAAQGIIKAVEVADDIATLATTAAAIFPGGADDVVAWLAKGATRGVRGLINIVLKNPGRVLLSESAEKEVRGVLTEAIGKKTAVMAGMKEGLQANKARIAGVRNNAELRRAAPGLLEETEDTTLRGARRTASDFTEEMAPGSLDAVVMPETPTPEVEGTPTVKGLVGRILGSKWTQIGLPAVSVGAALGAGFGGSSPEPSGQPMMEGETLGPMDQMKLQGQELRNLMMIKKLMEEAERNTAEASPSMPRFF